MFNALDNIKLQHRKGENGRDVITPGCDAGTPGTNV
jgi:hypothetical protein